MTGNNYILTCTQDIKLGSGHDDTCRTRLLRDRRFVSAIKAPESQYGLHTCTANYW